MSILSDYRAQAQAAADALSVTLTNGNGLGLITKVTLQSDGTALVRIFVEDTKIEELTAEPTP